MNAALITTSTLLTPVDHRPLRTFTESSELNVAGIDFCRALGYRHHREILARLGPDCVIKRMVSGVTNCDSTSGAKTRAWTLASLMRGLINFQPRLPLLLQS